MSTRSKIISITITLSLSLAGLWSVNENAGTTGFNALKMVHGARAMALGQSLTGEAINPDGLHFNPAAILNVPGPEVSTTYCNYFVDAQGGQVQLLLPKNKFTAWGLALKYMNMGTIERTEVDQFDNLIDDLGTFGAYNVTASVSLAKFVSKALDFGGSLKVIYDTLDDASAAAVLVDLGIIHHPFNEKVKVGVSLRNMGAQLSYYSDSKYKEKLPFTFAAGGSYRFSDKNYSIVEINKADGENFNLRLGHEYNLTPDFALRAGFRTNAADWNNGGAMGWSSGLSLGAGLNWKNYRFDYAVSSYGDLGLVNQLSLVYEF